VKMKFSLLAAALVAFAPSVSAYASKISILLYTHAMPNEFYPCDAGFWQASNGDDYLKNSMHFMASPRQGNPSNPFGQRPSKSGTLKQKSAASGAKLASTLWDASNSNDLPPEFNTEIHSLTFDFGSDTYGAHFFVDFCYFGPEIPFFREAKDLQFKTNFSASANILTRKPLFANPQDRLREYNAFSKVGMQWEMACDVQGQGKYKYEYDLGNLANKDGIGSSALDITESSSVAVNPTLSDGGYSAPASGLSNWVGHLSGDVFVSGAIPNSKFLSPHRNELFGIQNKFWVTRNSPNAPRFCKLRTYFIEVDTKDRQRALQRGEPEYLLSMPLNEEAID
jgi:hypothetical protein